MPVLYDPSVHREVDAYVEHLVSMIDDQSFDFEDDEFWSGNRPSRGGGVEALQAAPPATFPDHR